MTKAERAVQLFADGFNCSQAVLTVFAEDFGIDEKLTLMLGTQFGGGARNAEMCGAVSGALMVLGLKYGHYRQGDTEQKSRAYAIAVDFTKRFKEANGSIVCRDLLGYDLTKAEDAAIIKEKNLFGTICPEMIKSAVEIIEEIFNDYK